MRYYNIPRYWTKRIAPHLSDPKVQYTLIHDMNKFTTGSYNRPFTAGMVPHDVESCDWFMWHRGPMPRYWQYVKHGACHWLVNLNLELAMRAAPEHDWCIVTSDQHSTVWNGAHLLFDMNYMALGVPPDECFHNATTGNYYVLQDGEHLPVTEPQPLKRNHHHNAY